MILSLIRDAIATEIRNWLRPAPVGAPLPADESPTIDQPVDQVVDSPWRSSQFHVEQLAATQCICGQPKSVGSYKCTACRGKR